MKKITTMLNSPIKIAGFTVCAVLLIGLIVFGTIQASAGINENKTIGMDKGVNVALSDAGFKAEDVANLNAHYDTEDGASVYEVSFTAGNFKYEYVVKASNGQIIEADREAVKGSVSADKTTASDNETASGDKQDTASSDKTTNANTSQGSSNTSTAGGITLKEAKSIALKHAGVSSGNATFVKAKQDYEDGIPVYEIEFYSGNTEYDYEIKVSNGDILSFDKDIENYSIPSSNSGSGSGSSSTPSSSYIGIDKAKSIALKDAGLSSSSVTFTKAKLDREDGIRVYEIEFFSADKEYEYEINATSGKIRDKDVEFNDDFDDDWDD